MARAVWSGSLTFGLVTVPVQLATATDSHTIRFRQLERGTWERVRNKRVNERTGEEVSYNEIVKGYDIGDGEYVIVAPEELDEITPGRSQSIEISGFVELGEIDPVFFATTYFLQPREPAHSKVYGLLHDALAETHRAGIATMSLRQKDHLVAVHAEGGVLVMHTLHWSDEVRDPHEQLNNLPSGDEASSKELEMATQLIETMAIEWKPDEYRDHTHERVRELIDAKQAGETVTKSEPAPESTNVVDLESALEASVNRARGSQQRAGAGKRSSAGSGSRSRSRSRSGKSTASGRAQQTAGSGSKKASANEDLGSLTKDELYRRATEAGVPGRSRMNRDELQRALARAEGTPQPGGAKAA